MQWQNTRLLIGNRRWTEEGGYSTRYCWARDGRSLRETAQWLYEKASDHTRSLARPFLRTIKRDIIPDESVWPPSEHTAFSFTARRESEQQERERSKKKRPIYIVRTGVVIELALDSLRLLTVKKRYIHTER